MTIQLQHSLQGLLPVLNYLVELNNTPSLLGRTLIHEIINHLVNVEYYNGLNEEKVLYKYIRENLFPVVYKLEKHPTYLTRKSKGFIEGVVRPMIIVLYLEAVKSTFGYIKGDDIIELYIHKKEYHLLDITNQKYFGFLDGNHDVRFSDPLAALIRLETSVSL